MTFIDSFKTLRQLKINETTYDYFSLPALTNAGLKQVNALPYSLKILLENLLRFEDDTTVNRVDIEALNAWVTNKTSTHEIAFRPARVLMQDFTGVPAVVDLGAMRDAVQAMGGDPKAINPLTPVDLVIDHSIQVDAAGHPEALAFNSKKEMERNKERYLFLRWGQTAFDNFRVVPPATGICHQVNLEFLAKTVWRHQYQGRQVAYPDTVVGTDSHTTMINSLGVLGWGVGGIEAEAAMLGQPVSMLIPEVVGVKLSGSLPEGATATDLVLKLTSILRKHNVVGKFVEYFGPGLAHLPVSDRATISNMAPEYGATCGFFPIDEATIHYLRLSGRDEDNIALVEAYSKAQGLWHDDDCTPVYTTVIELDLASITPAIAGPKRPQDRIELNQLKNSVQQLLKETRISSQASTPSTLHHGDVVIAAITSCTNTSNPAVLIAAGLLAKKAVEKGLKCKPWVKTSLAPGSQVVSRYLQATGLQVYLDQLGFEVVGYGCTTCIGNSGPFAEDIAATISENDLVVSAVLSGNRNFEGRIHPLVKANWLASPPLVVAFALAGTTAIDLTTEALGSNAQGQAVFLKDIWPSNAEIAQEIAKITREMFKEQYADVFAGDAAWQNLHPPTGETYAWQADSSYIQHPPFFSAMQIEPAGFEPIKQARILALFGDSITTDHISPAGSIKVDSPAGHYLQAMGVTVSDFNSYGARRGNHEVMMRGTFANIRIKNEMTPGVEGGVTKHYPSEELVTIFDAAMRYQQDNVPLIVIAGKEYGTGSSRDWAAKGPKLLGVSAVIAESFERIHRSNLIGMGILPLQFTRGVTRKTLNLDGSEQVTVIGMENGMMPRAELKAVFMRCDGSTFEVMLLSRVDTNTELDYFRHGGILQFVLRNILRDSKLKMAG